MKLAQNFSLREETSPPVTLMLRASWIDSPNVNIRLKGVEGNVGIILERVMKAASDIELRACRRSRVSAEASVEDDALEKTTE